MPPLSLVSARSIPPTRIPTDTFHQKTSTPLQQRKSEILRCFAPPLLTTFLILSPLCKPPASFSHPQVEVQKGASLFQKACIGCHDAGGNLLQPGATLFLKDLQRNNIATEEGIYGITYYGKGRMPVNCLYPVIVLTFIRRLEIVQTFYSRGFGINCAPRGQCTFGPRLQDEEIELLTKFVKSQADGGWPKLEFTGD